MTVSFYKFSKAVNSTKQPSSGNTDHLCVLKKDCSEHDPVLILNSQDFGYTYAYISDWGKYYFVRDVVSLSNNHVEYHLTEDVLATYKSDIGDTKAHIAFCTNGYDEKVIDSRLLVENHRTLYFDEESTTPAFPTGLSDGGSYILTVFNNAAVTSSGMSVSYILSQTGMNKARGWFATQLNAISTYFNGAPLSAIMSCIWVPYSIPTTGGYITAETTIEIGNQSSGPNVTFSAGELYSIEGFPIISRHYTQPIHLAHGDHTAKDFRDQEPYTTGMLYLPGAGFVQISLGDWFDVNNIQIETLIECNTGNIRYNLWRKRELINLVYQYSELVQTVDCCVAATCPLGQITTNATGVVSSIGTMVGGAVGLAGSIAATVATEGAAAPLIMASAGTLIAGAANTALSANQHATTVTGTNGTRMASINKYFKYYEAVMDMEDPDDTVYIDYRGRPCGIVSKIKNMFQSPYTNTMGFIQCENGSVVSKANLMEKTEINSYLNSGFFWE